MSASALSSPPCSNASINTGFDEDSPGVSNVMPFGCDAARSSDSRPDNSGFSQSGFSKSPHGPSQIITSRPPALQPLIALVRDSFERGKPSSSAFSGRDPAGPE